MPTYSGNIGELISFDVENASAITGVFFGNGLSKSFESQSNNTTLNARVPEDASWGYVTFYKDNFVTSYNAIGTGLKETGALHDLEANLSASGLLGACTSGSLTYSNLYDASGICYLTTTGTTESLASGRFYDAYGSGLCGDDFDPSYIYNGYSESTTRVFGFSTSVDSSGDWLAAGHIQDTGNFIYQKALVELSCSTPVQESTDYKFVPIPMVSTFTPKEGQEGNPLLIYGKALADVSAVDISGVPVSFEVTDNFTVSGTIPSGAFNNPIRVTGPSGVKANSLSNFVSLSSLLSDPQYEVMSLVPGQFVKKSKGDTDSAIILGRNLSGLSAVALTDESNQITNILSNPDFNYNLTSLQVPVSGLGEGLYDIFVSAVGQLTASLSDVISIVDAPLISYSFTNVSTTSGFIHEPQMYSSRESAYTVLSDKEYAFKLTGQANKICLLFNNENIKDGEVEYELERDLGNNSNTISLYYINGLGSTSASSQQRASNMFNSGIYTRDWYGDPYDEYSRKFRPCVCSISSSGTSNMDDISSEFLRSGLVTGILTGEIDNHPIVAPIKELCREDFASYVDSLSGSKSCTESGFTYASGIVGNTSYDEIALFATGYTEEQNISNISQQLEAYPGYEATNWYHISGTTHQVRSYASGINYPYFTNLLTNFASKPWENILHSGVADITALSGEQVSLVSGYSIINSTGLSPAGGLSVTGKNESSARSALEYILSTGYSQCETGSYSTSLVGVTGSVTRTGITYGYC